MTVAVEFVGRYLYSDGKRVAAMLTRPNRLTVSLLAPKYMQHRAIDKAVALLAKEAEASPTPTADAQRPPGGFVSMN